MAEAKRPRGAPRKTDDEKVVPVSSKVRPDTKAAWQASGRTLDDVMRAGLVSLGAL